MATNLRFLNIIELYSENEDIVGYVNDTSIRLFKKKRSHQKHRHSQGSLVPPPLRHEMVRPTGWSGSHNGKHGLPFVCVSGPSSGGQSESSTLRPVDWVLCGSPAFHSPHSVHLGAHGLGISAGTLGGLGISHSKLLSWSSQSESRLDKAHVPANRIPGAITWTNEESAWRWQPGDFRRFEKEEKGSRRQETGDVRIGSLLKCTEFTQKWKSMKQTAHTKAISKGRLSQLKKHSLIFKDR